MNALYQILHLTDLHWDDETGEDQKLVIRKFEADLKTIVVDKNIDVVIFSGDLVAKGQFADGFLHAKRELFEPMQTLFGLSNNDILICPGNHDVDRSIAQSQTYLEAGLKAELQDSQSLNRHVDRYFTAPPARDDASLRLANYFDFTRAHFNKNLSLTSSYVDCVIKKANFGEIGFALFNSAWRSTGAGEVERNQMLLAERAVDKAAEQLKACDLKIAVMHHPLEWLAPWNQKSVRNPLFVNFDLVLFGHVHETMPTLAANTIGECLFAQGGALYLHREYYNGYQIVDISVDGAVTFDFHLRTWFDNPRRGFGPAENICAGGLKTFQIRSSADASKKLQISDLLAIQNATDEMANAHFRALQLKNDATFDKSFTCPPLSEKTHDELLNFTRRPIGRSSLS